MKDAGSRRGTRISNKLVQIKASTGIETSPRKRKLADRRVFERRLISPFIAHDYIAALLSTISRYYTQYSATRLHVQNMYETIDSRQSER